MDWVVAHGGSRAAGLLLAAWLAVYATHTLHALPASDHAGHAVADAAPVAVAAGSLGVAVYCAVEAVGATAGPWLVVLLVALVVARAGAGAPLVRTAWAEARAGPRDRHAALQVFLN